MFIYVMAGRPENIKTPVGKRLRELRGGLTRDQFSDQIGCNKATYGNYERGDRSPELDFLTKLIQATGVSLNWVATGKGPKYIREVNQPAKTSKAVDMELLEACIQGTEEHLAAADQAIDSGNKALIIANLYSLRVKERAAATDDSDKENQEAEEGGKNVA